nr:MAG TPA: hypothetical protein [Caudoviricetes sp.]
MKLRHLKLKYLSLLELHGVYVIRCSRLHSLLSSF